MNHPLTPSSWRTQAKPGIIHCPGGHTGMTIGNVRVNEMAKGLPYEKDVETLVEYIQNNLRGLGEAQLDTEYDYAGVPLCVIDAVFSLGVRYESTRRTVQEFCTAQGWEMVRAKSAIEPTTSELLTILEPYSDQFATANVFRNRQRTSTKGGITKAEAVYRFAKTLYQFGIETLSDALAKGRDPELKRRIQDIPGQRSGLSFAYFRILVGDREAVKPDRMVRRFVAQALGRRTVTQEYADKLLIQACAILRQQFPGLSPAILDNVIWKHQRGQAPQTTSRRHDP